MSGFDFFNAVVAGFQTFKKGARLLNEVTPEEEGFATPPTVDLDTKVRPAKAPLREMEKPLGLFMPKMDTAYRYFATSLARDVNLRNIQSTDYYVKPVSPQKAKMNVSTDAKVKGFTASYKTTGVTGL